MNISGRTDYVSWLISVTVWVWAAPVQWTSMQPHHDGVNIVRTEQSQKIFDIMDLFFQQHICWRAEEKSTKKTCDTLLGALPATHLDSWRSMFIFFSGSLYCIFCRFEGKDLVCELWSYRAGGDMGVMGALMFGFVYCEKWCQIFCKWDHFVWLLS